MTYWNTLIKPWVSYHVNTVLKCLTAASYICMETTNLKYLFSPLWLSWSSHHITTLVQTNDLTIQWEVDHQPVDWLLDKAGPIKIYSCINFNTDIHNWVKIFNKSNFVDSTFVCLCSTSLSASKVNSILYNGEPSLHVQGPILLPH